jgi:DNA-binding NarL/FixJ family response regulator
MEVAERMIRVFIVDDRELIRRGLRYVLESVEAFEIVGEAANSADAVSAIKELEPDVVILDGSLPGAGPVDAIRQIKDDSPDTGVVLMSTEGTGIDILSAIQAGANGYMLKNLTPSQLGMAVRIVAAGGAWLHPSIASSVLHSAKSNVPEEKQEAKLPDGLTKREQEVLLLMTKGFSNKQIGQELSLSLDTVKTHVRNIFKKLGVEDRIEAVVKVLRPNLTHQG